MKIPWVEGFPDRGTLAGAYPKLARPVWGHPVRMVLLGGPLWSIWSHYDQAADRTAPCSGEGQCAYCPDPGRRADGYLAAFDREEGRRRVVHLTDSGLAQFERATAQTSDYRGLLIEVSRADRRRMARQVVKLLGLTATGSLPPWFDVRPFVGRAFGMVHWEVEKVQDAGAEQ